MENSFLHGARCAPGHQAVVDPPPRQFPAPSVIRGDCVDRYLTPKQAAEQAGVSVSLVYAWCDEQRLAHYRVGREGRRGRIRIGPADLDAFLRTLRQPEHPLLAGGR